MALHSLWSGVQRESNAIAAPPDFSAVYSDFPKGSLTVVPMIYAHFHHFRWLGRKAVNSGGRSLSFLPKKWKHLLLYWKFVNILPYREHKTLINLSLVNPVPSVPNELFRSSILSDDRFCIKLNQGISLSSSIESKLKTVRF